ncbi:MAG: ROK family protein [Eubacteriales bacterium]|nr:ROK family protein [Eubacteriales bacterium]
MANDVITPLDPGFAPLSLAYRAFCEDVSVSGAARFVARVVRGEGRSSAFETRIFPDGVDDARNVAMMDRLVKSLLWIRGGYHIQVSGSMVVYEHLKAAYQPGGSRDFDALFMANVYERPFMVEYVADPDVIANSQEASSAIGRHLDGCRIGFDAGGSDRKVSAVMDGKTVFSEEVIWFPKVTEDPEYHYREILSAFRTAASHLPRVDAIGISSAGIFINNKVRTASLFLAVPEHLYSEHVRDIYIKAAGEIGPVPVTVANDGDVTALAGAMGLGKGRILGLAMGTSEAGGYVDKDMHIMGWLNELAFVPVDMSDIAARDEWSGDIGCGLKYFSQDAVIKLAPAAGIVLDQRLSPADKLKHVQRELEQGHEGAARIFETIGIYLAYALAWYALFYDIGQVLILGRVTSGKGGLLILEKARETLQKEFPGLADAFHVALPDEATRRVGQSIAAASLPEKKR